MAKNIIKEIIIILLLIIAIILVLGVLMYEYVPTNKIIPEKVSYTTPEETKNELEEDVDENEEELYVDYHIDSTQLNNYKKIQEYVPGRKNPFDAVGAQTESSTTTDNNQGSSDNTSSSNSSSSSNNSSIKNNTNGQDNSGYLPNKGTK